MLIEEEPAFFEEQPPVYKSHRPAPVEPPKPSEPISEATWEAIQVGPQNKRTFTDEEREEILYQRFFPFVSLAPYVAPPFEEC